MPTRERIGINDLLAATLYQLAERRVQHIWLGNIDWDMAMEQVWQELQAAGVAMDFRIVPDPLHGDSPTAREAMVFAAMCGLVRLQDRCAYLQIGPGEGDLARDGLAHVAEHAQRAVSILIERDLVWPPLHS
jgi:hypothetical protein